MKNLARAHACVRWPAGGLVGRRAAGGCDIGGRHHRRHTRLADRATSGGDRFCCDLAAGAVERPPRRGVEEDSLEEERGRSERRQG